MDDYRAFIISVLEEVSAIATKNFGFVAGVVKEGDNNQVLSATDIAIGNLIIERIRQAFPTHNIIDEEAGVIDHQSQYTWVVDPIDGTSNFVNGVPTYGIMIGLLDDNDPVAGGVAIPPLNEVYSAARHKGALCNNQKITVTGEKKLLNTLVAYGIDGHQENPDLTRQEMALLTDLVLHIRNLRTSNSVFDQMMVAKGTYGASLNRTSKIWDNVAQQIIIEEAGGVYTDFYGEVMDYSQPLTKTDTNFTWCAAPTDLHQQLMQILNR